MNNEKVKEIKESLQQEIHLTEYADMAYAETVGLNLLKDVLTLINELESENKRLNKAINSVQKGFDNGEFISKNCQTRTLKQFVERLIDKYGYDKLTHEPDEDIEIYLTASELDETLKEYEKYGRG